MCGISGIFGSADVQAAREAVARMNSALAHRGPDAAGIFDDHNVVLGHRRLSIIDLTEHSNQPMHSHDGRWVLVFNGELYNYRELKSTLSDYPYRTDSDTEVVLAAWSKWGEACLQKFNGMFAFALWDRQNQELFLVRDRMGIKPLYVSRAGNEIVFGSEVRSILASGRVAADLNPDALVDYLRYQTVHAPATILRDVEMLLPGHLLHVQDNEVSSRSWWSAGTHWSRAALGSSLEDIHAAVRQKLRQSVELRMRADVEYGAFLSGGIDSSAIVGLMAEVSDRPVQTFAVTFDEREFSEARFSDMVARKFNTRHTEIRLTPEDFLETIPHALNAMDHPSGDGPNTYVVSKVTKEAGITMALSGLGGDELFAGYDVFRRMVQIRSKKWLMSFPKFMRNVGGQALRIMKPGVSSDKIHAVLTQDYLDFEYVYPLERQVFLNPVISKLLTYPSLPQNAVHRIVTDQVGYGNPGFDLPILSKVSAAEINTYMQHVLLRDSDQMSMAHALEVRVPFLDHHLVEYVLGIPDITKFPTSPKQLLINSLDGLLPEEVYNRPKMGFTLPWEVWMKGSLKAMCESHLKNLGQRDAFQGDEVMKLWSRFLKGDPAVTWSRLWPLVVLDHWLTRNGCQ